MAGADKDRQSDLAVMEANEYKQKRRLQRILDAHDAVEDRGNEAYRAYAEGTITHDAKNIIVLRSVQQYIREVYNLLREYDRELEEGEENEYWKQPVLGRIEMEHGDDVVFRGLSDVLFADQVYREEWEEEVEARHGKDQTETHTAQYTVPEEVSLRAFLLVNQFLDAEKSLEIQFEELDDNLPAWGFEEVDEDIDDVSDVEVL